MEYIPGEDLRDVWESLGMINKLWLAWTLRTYVAQLRKVHLANRDIPGPLDGSGTPLPCIGHYFTEMGAGQFASYREMTSWFDSKYRITLQLEEQSTPETAQKRPEELSFDSSMPLVLTHGDISLNNIRLGRDGTLWLLDWEHSGAYPEWFEYSCILAYENSHKIPRAWLHLAPFIAGEQESKHTFLRRIMPALQSFWFEEQ
jgi:thiamine kinase-like enzyme